MVRPGVLTTWTPTRIVNEGWVVKREVFVGAAHGLQCFTEMQTNHLIPLIRLAQALGMHPRSLYRHAAKLEALRVGRSLVVPLAVIREQFGDAVADSLRLRFGTKLTTEHLKALRRMLASRLSGHETMTTRTRDAGSYPSNPETD